MSKYVTQADLDEAAALSERWESLSTDQLNRFLYLCESIRSHAELAVDFFGATDPEGLIDGMAQVITKIQERLEVQA